MGLLSIVGNRFIAFPDTDIPNLGYRQGGEVWNGCVNFF